MGDLPEYVRSVKLLKNGECFLLLTHQRPDGDAFGSLFGLGRALLDLGKRVYLYQSTPLAGKYIELFPAVGEMGFVDARGVEELLSADNLLDAVICLDCANFARLDLPKGLLEIGKILVPVYNWDHHAGNEGYGDVNLICGQVAATAQIVAGLLRDVGYKISAAVANCLLCSLATDTGGFHFPNTDASVLEEAARLVADGADYGRVMHRLFLQFPYNRKLLESKLLLNAKFAHNNRLIYTELWAGDLQNLKLKPEDTEGLIDSIKVVEGVRVACLLQVEGRDVRLSLRSQSASCPVDGIAARFGGGGHAMAAGAVAKNCSIEEVEKLLIKLTARFCCMENIDSE